MNTDQIRAHPRLFAALIAGRQPETINERVPVEVTVGRLVLRREDHLAAIYRVDADGAVITPASQSGCLNAASNEHGCFVPQRADWIGWPPIRITNTRNDCAGIRDVVANRDASGLVHRSTSHPPEIVGRSERSLLEKDWIR